LVAADAAEAAAATTATTERRARIVLSEAAKKCAVRKYTN
jgi:hypothetical protein